MIFHGAVHSSIVLLIRLGDATDGQKGLEPASSQGQHQVQDHQERVPALPAPGVPQAPAGLPQVLEAIGGQLLEEPGPTPEGAEPPEAVGKDKQGPGVAQHTAAAQEREPVPADEEEAAREKAGGQRAGEGGHEGDRQQAGANAERQQLLPRVILCSRSDLWNSTRPIYGIALDLI